METKPDKLSREQIMAALRRLDELLREKGVIGELCISGGAAMVLAFDARESTRDVDAIFVPKTEMLEAASRVGEEMTLRPDWLNDGVRGFVLNQGEVTAAGMPVFANLRIMRPTAEYLLAMKCLGSRRGGAVGEREFLPLSALGNPSGAGEKDPLVRRQNPQSQIHHPPGKPRRFPGPQSLRLRQRALPRLTQAV